MKCFLQYLDCNTLKDSSRKAWAENTTVFSTCDPNKNTGTFEYGIFANAVTENVVSSDFVEKYLYCLWWGLQNLRYIYAHSAAIAVIIARYKVQFSVCYS